MKTPVFHERKHLTHGGQGPQGPLDGTASMGRLAVCQILRGSALQPKLAVGAPDDVFEQEADCVAEQVMRMPEPSAGKLPNEVSAKTASPEIRVTNAIIEFTEPTRSDQPVDHPDVRTGGGQYYINCSDVTYPEGKKLEKTPDVQISYQKESNVWSLEAVFIHSHIVTYSPGEHAYPVVGVNVTNDKNHGILKDGKGYWISVINNMINYKNYYNYHKLQWWAPCTKVHEEVHRKQWKDWFSKNKDKLLSELKNFLEEKIKKELEENGENTSENTEEILKDKIQVFFIKYDYPRDEIAPEKDAYKAAYNNCWRPAIKKIIDDAKERGWAGVPPDY